MQNALGFLLTLFWEVLTESGWFVPCQSPNPAAQCVTSLMHPSGSTGPSPELCALKACARKTPQPRLSPLIRQKVQLQLFITAVISTQLLLELHGGEQSSEIL